MTLFQARGISEEFRIHRASPTQISLSYYTISCSHQLQSLTAGSVPERVLRNSGDIQRELCD